MLIQNFSTKFCVKKIDRDRKSFTRVKILICQSEKHLASLSSVWLLIKSMRINILSTNIGVYMKVWSSIAKQSIAFIASMLLCIVIVHTCCRCSTFKCTMNCPNTLITFVFITMQNRTRQCKIVHKREKTTTGIQKKKMSMCDRKSNLWNNF